MEQTEQTQNNINWIQQELDANKQQQDFEKVEALKFEENKEIEIEINFSQPFRKWTTEIEGKKITKAILPVKVGDLDRVWWLNIRNPFYGEIMKLGATGQTKFRIVSTGKMTATRYILLK